MDPELQERMARFDGDGPNWSAQRDRHERLEDLLAQALGWLLRASVWLVIAGLALVLWVVGREDRRRR